MALVLADRVKETTTTTGTGTVTLNGAVTGYQSFAAIGNANTVYYAIAGQGTTEWEVGLGTYTSAGTTLSRTTVLASSNAGSLVSFSAGAKDVFVTYPAGKAVYLDASGNATPLGTIASGVWNGTAVSVAYGGTGATNATAYAVLCGGTTSTGAHQSVVSVGTSGQVLTSNGAGALPTFQAPVSPFPSGTAMVFAQTAAPTGWTKVTTNNDAALRVVSGSASTGGTVGFTTAFASQAVSGSVGTSGSTTATGTVGATTLTTTQIPSHTHTYSGTSGYITANHQHLQTGWTGSVGANNLGFLPNGAYTGAQQEYTGTVTANHQHDYSGTTAGTGSSGSHDHSFTGAAHTHSGGTFTGTAINLAVKYVDVIIATKD